MQPIDDETRTAVAYHLGMKPSEIIAVADAGPDVAVQTHDGRWTLIREDGSLEHGVEAPPSPVDQEPEADPNAVPDKVADVLAWVGDDLDRAVLALEHEQGRDKPRTTLVEALEKLLQPAGDA